MAVISEHHIKNQMRLDSESRVQSDYNRLQSVWLGCDGVSLNTKNVGKFQNLFPVYPNSLAYNI